MRATYGDHFELDDGNLIPAPGQCHPALRGFADRVVACGEQGMREVEIPILTDPRAAHPSTTEAPELAYTSLLFQRRTVVVRDPAGNEWTWYCWIDQFGRGISEKRRKR